MIKQINLSEIPDAKPAGKKGSLCLDLESFISSGWKCCEVDTSKYKSANSALGAYAGAISRRGIDVKAIQRDGRVFLVRE